MKVRRAADHVVRAAQKRWPRFMGKTGVGPNIPQFRMISRKMRNVWVMVEEKKRDTKGSPWR